MVNSIFEPLAAEDTDCDFNLKNLKDQSFLEHFDTKFQDFSLEDSFLDFDSINWFEEKSAQEMDVSKDSNFSVGKKPIERVKEGGDEQIQEQSIVDGSQVNVVESVSVVKMERDECEKLESLCCNIEQEMGRVSLVGGDENSVVLNVEGENHKTMDDEDGERSEHERDSQASSSSYGSASGSGMDEVKNGSDDDVEGDVKEQEENHEVLQLCKQKKLEDVYLEFEEGEIRDSDASESKMIAWTGSDDIDEDDVDKEDDDVVDEIYDHAEGVLIKSKNELKVLPPVPPVDVMLQPHHQLVPIGVVLSVISAQVIVEATKKHNPLNEGSVLWITDCRSPLGRVDEVFGPVKLPYYVVRYNSEDEVPAEVKEGTPISFVPNFVIHVLNEKELYKKGYDASGENDEEVSDDGEFSDDEKEERVRSLRKLAKRTVGDNKPENKKNNKTKLARDRNWKQFQPFSHRDGTPFRYQGHENTPATSVSTGEVASFSAPGHGPTVGTAMPQQFAPINSGLNPPMTGFSADGIPPQQLSQNSFLPNGFPTGGTQLHPNQMPVTGMQFDRQVNPIQNLVSAIMSSLNQQNASAGSMCPQGGFVGQNHVNYGMGLPAPSSHPLMNQQGLVGQNQINFGLGLPVGSSHPLMNQQGLVGQNQTNFQMGFPAESSQRHMNPQGLPCQNQMNFGAGLPVAPSQPLMHGGGQGLIPNVGLLGQNQMIGEVGFQSSRPPMYPQGLVCQNQMNYGMCLPVASSQPLVSGFQSCRPFMNIGEQGVMCNGRLVGQNQMNFQAGSHGSHPVNNGGGQGMKYNTYNGQNGTTSSGLLFEKDNNLEANALGNAQAPQQFNVGASASQQRKPIQQRGGRSAGKRGWRKTNHR